YLGAGYGGVGVPAAGDAGWSRRAWMSRCQERPSLTYLCQPAKGLGGDFRKRRLVPSPHCRRPGLSPLRAEMHGLAKPRLAALNILAKWQTRPIFHRIP